MTRSTGHPASWVPRVIAILALPLALYALYATGQKAIDSYRMAEQTERVRSEIQQLQEENLRLQREIERARSDAYIERMAREQLGLVKPGDHALVIIGPSSGAVMPQESEASAAERSRTATETVPTWKQWWRFFFGPR